MIMYQFSYSAIFEESRARVPPSSCLISNAIELFGASSRSSFQPFERLQLLSDFRRLWLLIADDLHRAARELPEAQRSGFPADVHSVLKEIERRRFNTSPRANATPEIWPERLS
jgi:flagellar biosynthesis regulator FlaF